MNHVIEMLLEMVEADPLPAAHTSSHWQRYGRETLIERRGEQLVLRPVGFEGIMRPQFGGVILHWVERLTYRSVTSQLKSYAPIWRMSKQLARDLSGGVNFYVFKSTCALAVLAEHWAAYRLSPRTLALIGDGYGFLGALIRRWQPGSRLYCIDLPKMLVFQANTHGKADPGARMSVLSANDSEGADITFVLPQDIERIPDEIDCAINIASMQEMNEFSIASYFTFLRRRSTTHSRFYCVNRLRKELPGGEIASFAGYPWQEDDEVFINGPCPYYTHFLGDYTLPNGPRALGMRVPFVNSFDGIHMHRLARLAPVS
ncbi:hypothetical protein HY626_01140 [Candidatus Uhrbacteria bacterium]|nr:hypothetical protein [Candidatus Uhrbacteria bacterium]